MYNLNACVFYIALVLLHEYFTQKAQLLPYTTELSLQTSLNSPNAMTNCKLASSIFAINDVIASVVAVKFGRAFC